MQRRGEVAHRRCRRFARNTDAATEPWVSPSCEALTNSTTRAAAERTRLTQEGGNERVSRESRRSNRSIVHVSGDSSKLHEMNPRKHRAASHKAGGACASRMRGGF